MGDADNAGANASEQTSTANSADNVQAAPVETAPGAQVTDETSLDMVVEPAPVALIAPPAAPVARSMGVDREATKRDASPYSAAVNAMRSIGDAAKSVADEIENVIGLGHPDLNEERIAALRHAQRGLTATHEGLADVLTKF